MTLRTILAAALAVALLGATHHHVRPRPKPPTATVYTAPAGDRATGIPNATAPFDAILPNGRIVAPIGTSTIVGNDAGGIALSPDGKFAIAGDDTGLTIVDAASMRVVGAFAIAGGASPAIAAAVDPADGSKTLLLAAGRTDDRLHLIDLNADGTLDPDGDPLAMPPSDGAPAADPLVTSIAVSTDGRTAFVAHRGGDTVSAVDLVNRRVVSDTVVGFAPAGLGVSGGNLFVTNEGVEPSADPDRSSSLDSLTIQSDGDIDGDPASASALSLDPLPDGTTTVGGAHPSAMALSPDGKYAYVCMTNVDRIEVVRLSGTPSALGGVSMQLFTGWPYGTQPVSIVASADGKRLYVALAGVNAVAILDSSDPAKLQRLGLLPTGWYPNALALSSDGRYLFVENAKGTPQAGGATVQRIDLRGLQPRAVTLSALRYNRIALKAPNDPLVPPIQSKRRSNAIRHVVFIQADGTATMPNLTALAAMFATSANFSPDADDPDDAMQYALGGIATAYERTSHRPGPAGAPRAGFITNSLAQAGLAYRGYGDFSDLAIQGGQQVPVASFPADFGALVTGDAVPAFTSIRLPDNADATLGSIVDYLTHAPQWSSTAIFIVSGSRTVVVSPYARRGFVGHRHLSTVSVLKTEEELLGLPALSLNDLLATDMADFFTSAADSASYVATGVESSPSQ